MSIQSITVSPAAQEALLSRFGEMEELVITGSAGSGKTTVAYLLGGLLRKKDKLIATIYPEESLGWREGFETAFGSKLFTNDPESVSVVVVEDMFITCTDVLKSMESYKQRDLIIKLLWTSKMNKEIHLNKNVILTTFIPSQDESPNRISIAASDDEGKPEPFLCLLFEGSGMDYSLRLLTVAECAK